LAAASRAHILEQVLEDLGAGLEDRGAQGGFDGFEVDPAGTGRGGKQPSYFGVLFDGD